MHQIVKLWIGPKLLVFLVDPRDVELVLSSHVYIDKSPEYKFFQPWLGNGLLTSTGMQMLLGTYSFHGNNHVPLQVTNGDPIVN